NTRWLSMSNSVKNLHQILDSVIDALRYDIELDKKNYQAKNLLDKLDYEFVIATKYLADLMFILTKLINIFQKELVSFSNVKIHLDTTYDAITAQFIGIDDSAPLYSTHLRKYMQDFNISSENLPSFIKSFSEAIISNLKLRFPQLDLYYSFNIFDPKLLLIKESELGNYGNQEIEKLVDYYGVDRFDGEGNMIEKIINSNDAKQEWAVSKYYIKQIRGQDIVGGWEYIFNLYPDFPNEFPNITKLVKISLIISLSNAQVERIFSQHKLTKTRLRNRMNIESLNKHLMILLNGPDDF
ncbi:14457_t:CDS:1, partial [Dentiscutata heterogama]